MADRDSRNTGYESDRFEILRTVEMETWSESRHALHDHTGPTLSPGHDVRAFSPVNEFDLKQGGVYITSAASLKSSGSVPDSISVDGKGR